MYKLGKTSLSRLEGVHPILKQVTLRAIEISEIDFSVGEGVRTLETQKEYVKSGKSKVLASRHVPENNKCNMSCAVDLWAYVSGGVSWEWSYYYKIAAAMKQAAQELGVELIWGGVFDSYMSEYEDTEQAVKDYTKRFKQKHNREPFIDGPHFQLPTILFP